MSEETAFLSTIRQTPADETTRLVYADWLDEQGDPSSKAKADFIRLERLLDDVSGDSPERINLMNQLQNLASTLDPGWLLFLSHPKVEGCQFTRESHCPERWDHLTPMGLKVRRCESCKRPVHYCDTLLEAQFTLRQRERVVISLAVIRQPNDLGVTRVTFPVRSQPTPEMIEQLRRAAGIFEQRYGATKQSRRSPPPLRCKICPMTVPKSHPASRECGE